MFISPRWISPKELWIVKKIYVSNPLIYFLISNEIMRNHFLFFNLGMKGYNCFLVVFILIFYLFSCISLIFIHSFIYLLAFLRMNFKFLLFRMCADNRSPGIVWIQFKDIFYVLIFQISIITGLTHSVNSVFYCNWRTISNTYDNDQKEFKKYQDDSFFI